jgi:DNA primase
MSEWVNFKELRESLDFGEVLRDYGVQVSVKGDQAVAFCPLPGHKERSKRKSKSFSVNWKRNIFQCFGCQAKGNVLDFAVLMEGGDPGNTEDFRRAALKLQRKYLKDGNEASPAAEVKRAKTVREAAAESVNVQRVINAPLDFALRNLDATHPYLHERGLTPETVAYFGLGYCTKGLMKGRIAIPLHDSQGRLIGYAGRLVDDAAVSDEEPKYKLPGDRKKDDVVHEFRKSEFLFNGHRFTAPLHDLVVVEGFFGAMWLHQCGYSNVVALMGASCSERQGQLLTDLLTPDGRLWVIPDGDDAGQKCAASTLIAAASHRLVRWVRLEPGGQPDNLSAEMLAILLATTATAEGQ